MHRPAHLILGSLLLALVACGGGGAPPPPPELALYAGSVSTPGSADGTGALAGFYLPNGIAADSFGTLYVADTGNDTLRKIAPGAIVTTLAGTAGTVGHADGTGAVASFNGPSGVAVDTSGNVYVADTVNSTIRKVTPLGVVSTLAGTALVTGSADGTGALASFYLPSALTTDSAGNVYVADTYNSTIRQITPAGVVTTLAGSAGLVGSTDATGSLARFNLPGGIARDSLGNLYVADTRNNTIRKIAPGAVVRTLAGTAGTVGHADGTGAAASFNAPTGIVADAAGNLYVADRGNSTVRKITPAGVVTTVAGQAGVVGFTPGPLPGVLANPSGVALFSRILYTTSTNAIVRVSSVP